VCGVTLTLKQRNTPLYRLHCWTDVGPNTTLVRGHVVNVLSPYRYEKLRGCRSSLATNPQFAIATRSFSWGMDLRHPHATTKCLAVSNCDGEKITQSNSCRCYYPKKRVRTVTMSQKYISANCGVQKLILEQAALY